MLLVIHVGHCCYSCPAVVVIVASTAIIHPSLHSNCVSTEFSAHIHIQFNSYSVNRNLNYYCTDCCNLLRKCMLHVVVLFD